LPALQVPFGGGRAVAQRSLASLVHFAKLDHRGGVALVGGLPKKPQGRPVVRRYAAAILEREAKFFLRRSVASLGGLTPRSNRLGDVSLAISLLSAG
jgi:hypothetical protein